MGLTYDLGEGHGHRSTTIEGENVAIEEEEEEEEEEHEGARSERSEQPQRMENERGLRALKARPGILVIGPPAVGKRTLMNRLLARGRSTQATMESGANCQGWAIDTKYYTANLCMWIARLGNLTLEDAARLQSEFGRCEALVMVFDLSSLNSFEQLQEWVTGVELESYEVLLCVGNKADRVPGHYGHDEYRRKLQKSGESSSDPHPEFWDFGIDRTEGSSLLENEGESLEDRRRCCVEWCSNRGIEYIETCAINEIFDECMSIDGDLQGIERVYGALSAHMWPGLIMKDGNEENDASAAKQDQEDMTSDDDSDYYIEYELLSNGSAEHWEASGWEEQWSFSNNGDAPAIEVKNSTSIITPPIAESDENPTPVTNLPIAVRSVAEGHEASELEQIDAETPSRAHVEQPNEVQDGHENQGVVPTDPAGSNVRKYQEFEDMEQLMNEMATMRTSMLSMSDQHRREMAARLALRMASMFSGDDDDNDGGGGI